MKMSKKVLAILLTIATLIGMFSCGTTVFAEDLNEYADKKAYQEKLLTESVETEAEKAEIVCEIPEKREEYSKTYKRADGSFTSVLSATPIHKLENGEWKDIDNTLKTDNETITNADGVFEVEFPETIAEDEKITINAEGESISFSINGIENSTGIIESSEKKENDVINRDFEKSISEIIYENVDDNTDLQYIVYSNSVKENIVVSNKESLKEAYSFEIQKGELSANLDNENNLIFKNDKDETVFKIPAPVMTDANNAVSYDIDVEIKNADKSVLTLIYTPSTKWLNSDERSYPIVIDPVVLLPGQDGDFFEDTVIMDEANVPNSRYTNYSNKYEGYISSSTERKAEVLVKLNMDAFEYLKSDNISVTDITTYFEGVVNCGNLIAKTVNGSYDINSVTYSDVYPTDNSEPMLTYGEEFDYFTGSSVMLSAQDSVLVNFNITDIFITWLNGATNNGFAIVPQDSSTEAMLLLNGYEYNSTGATGSKIEAYCTVDYVDTSCSNDAFEYLTQEIGRAGSASVNTFTRGLSISRSDMFMDGLRMPVNISFNYGSACANFIRMFNNTMEIYGEPEIPLHYGNSWLPSYSQYIYTIDENQFQFFTEEGTIVTFNQSEETIEETDENGNETTTEIVFEADETSDGGYSLELINQEYGVFVENFKITNPDGETIYFNEMGFVTEIHETEPNSDGSYDKIIISYDEETPFKIDSVTDGIGRKYDFVYNSQTGLLSEVKCLTENGTPIKAGTTNVDLKTTYSYDNNGNLTSVTYPDGEAVSYTYSNKGKLTKAQNIDGYNIQYTYDSLGKVTYIAEYAGNTPGNTIALTQFSNRQVKVVDGYNGTETYQFGRDGRLNYTFDEKGNYLKSDYAPAKDENVYSSNDWEISSQNLLKNGTFEETQSAKALNWTNSFNVEDIEASESATDYVCRVTAIEETNTLQNQTIQVDGGKNYTFSLYAKNVDGAEENERLCIEISAKDENGNKSTETKYLDLTDEFEQYSVTINKETEIKSVTVAFGFDGSKGDFYVNNAQLEKGHGTAPFNYIKNGSFNSSDDFWTSAIIVDKSLNGNPVKTVKLTGGLPQYNADDILQDHISATTQNIKINGKKGQVYSVGGWFKGVFDDNYIYENVPTQYTELAEQLTNSSAQIKITYSYTDSVTETAEDGTTSTTQQTLTESFAVDFAPHNHDWQYAVDSFALKGDTESVDVTIIAKNIINDSFATGVELVLDDSAYELEAEDELVPLDVTFSEKIPKYYSNSTTETLEECTCEDCEEVNCDCRCANEILCTCVQCKRGTTKEYDVYGNVISTVKTDGISTMETETIYSSDGNYLAGAKDENEVVSTFTESLENDTALPLQVSVAGRTENYTFNAGTHLETVNKTVSGLASGNQMQVAYSYDNDRITKVTNNGYSYNFEYDKWGNIATEKVGNQVIANYYYGANQYNKQLDHILYENGQFVFYGYDTLGNINAIKYSNDTDWRFTFDYTNSKKTTITDKVQNQLKEITEKGYTITDLTTDQIIYSKTDLTEKFNGAEYTKTINDEVYAQTDGSTLQSYVLSGIANSTKTLGFSKLADWFGRDEKKTVSVNGSSLSLEKEFKYKDGIEQNSTTKYVEEISNSIKVNDAVNSAETFKYTYDIHGNVKTVSTCINGITTLQYEYYYDEANQIVRVDDYINNITTTYQYDMGGNIVCATEFERENYSAESVAIKEDSYAYDSAWKDKLSSVNGKAMTYDLIGNLLTYDGKTHTWIAGRKLETFQNADYSLEFTYDENGLRSSKTVNQNGTSKTIKYTWADGKLIGQMDGTDTLRFIYDDSEESVGFINNDNEIYLYIKNIFGDVIGIVDENGSTVVSYEYDVWGKLLSVSGSLAGTLGQLNPIRYRGYYYDCESGYYYLQSRYYDPELRRFINADKLESLRSPKNTYLYADSVNTFAYCANSPVNMVDYSGKKEANNTSNYLANVLVFAFVLGLFNEQIIIKSDKGMGGIYKKSKKGVIAIEIETEDEAEYDTEGTFSDCLFDFYEILGDKVFDALGIYSLEKFYDDFKKKHNTAYENDKTKQRAFLFSDKCVIQEIKHHCLGYWYVEGLIPLKNTSYRLLVGTFGNKIKLKKSCREIDIAEQDVFKKEQSLAFRYCYGIRNCYLFTMADPYWYGEYERYETPRSDWKNKKIPWNAKPLEWK